MKAPITLHNTMYIGGIEELLVAIRKESEIAIEVAKNIGMVTYRDEEEQEIDQKALESKIILLAIQRLTKEVMIRQ
jgi:hypothetical protein